MRLSESQGCLTCHGHPSTSPWKNGKDILGYKLENMKDGDLKGAFAVQMDLAPIIASAKADSTKLALWCILASLGVIIVSVLLLRGPLGSLNQVASNLEESNSELNASSENIAGVSHALSAASQESSASLQETVASIEEISSMVSSNAENAKEASQLSQVCQQSAEKGEKEMQELKRAMGEISQSSKKIEEIVSVINDIAFQTNLLALNAAVEAARAGDQGKGFAVVAEAVRDLAQRSANSAKDIASLIQESVSKVDRGLGIAQASGDALTEIVDRVKKVNSINAEIASASREQASGIGQISKAMNQLDQVTQQNVESAQNSSDNAQELSRQAGRITEIVTQLSHVLNGDNSQSVISAPLRLKEKSQHSKHTGGKLLSFSKLKKGKASDAKNIIPFDEDETNAPKVGNLDGF